MRVLAHLLGDETFSVAFNPYYEWAKKFYFKNFFIKIRSRIIHFFFSLIFLVKFHFSYDYQIVRMVTLHKKISREIVESAC